MEYALTQPRRLASIVIESSPAGISGWVSEANRSRAQLPDIVQEALEKHEAAGNDRRSRIPRGGDGLLSPARVPAGAVAGLREACVREARGESGSRLHDERTE